jgi:hypothetical protein
MPEDGIFQATENVEVLRFSRYLQCYVGSKNTIFWDVFTAVSMRDIF